VVEMFDEAWFAEGERILRQGFTGTGFYLILDGSAAVRIDDVDRVTLRPGDYFGEISCLLGVPPVSDIVATRPLRCLVMSATDLEHFLVGHPKVMFRLLQGEARKLRSTTKWQS
jgi:CRP-like cAMP-binding protein